MEKKYFIIRYREDVTGISEACLIAGAFGTWQEAEEYFNANALALQSENPYYVHFAEQKNDGHYYFLGDSQIVYPQK